VPIADDSAQIRRGLTGLFALVDDIEVIAEAADGVEDALVVGGSERADVRLARVRSVRRRRRRG
jgi:YesN/AraC family two-component response regulator